MLRIFHDDLTKPESSIRGEYILSSQKENNSDNGDNSSREKTKEFLYKKQKAELKDNLGTSFTLLVSLTIGLIIFYLIKPIIDQPPIILLEIELLTLLIQLIYNLILIVILIIAYAMIVVFYFTATQFVLLILGREIKYVKTDIKKIDELFKKFENSSHLSKLYKNRVYEFWKPNLTNFLISSVELPKEIIIAKLDFEEKVYQSTLIPVILGFTFVILTELSKTIDLTTPGGLIAIFGLFIAFLILFLAISYLLFSRILLRRQIALFIKTQDT